MPRRVDLIFAGGPRTVGQTVIGRRKIRILEQRVRLRCCAIGHPNRSRAWPFSLEKLGQAGDGVCDTWQDRVTIARIVDRGLHNLAQRHRAMIAQHQHPPIKGTGHHGRQQSRPRNKRQTLRAVVLHRCGCGCHTLRAQHINAACVDGIEDRWHIPCWTVQMRLHHLQGKRRRYSSIKRVAAFLEDTHADSRGDPMRRGHNPKRASDLWSGGEIRHGASGLIKLRDGALRWLLPSLVRAVGLEPTRR